MIAYINGVGPYAIDKGWTWIKNYNETLDSAVIKISHISSRIDIQPFDNVQIKNDGNTYVVCYMCVDSYQEVQASLDGPYYNYTINLFSETKKLENIILPNLSITPHKLSAPLTIREFAEQVFNLYVLRSRKGTPFWTLNIPSGTELGARFDRVCPEKQWTTPTLRDVLNDLFMVCDCIPVMQNNVIGLIDLTATRYPITNYNYITRSRSSQDYASELKMNLQNVLQNEYTVKTYEYLTFSSESFIVTTNNLFVETQYPILNINHLWIKFPILNPAYAETQQGIAQCVPEYQKIDLCNLKLVEDTETYSIVKEKKEYDVLKAVKYVNSDTITRTTAADFSNYKNTCLYFTRGSNRIFGFSTVNKVTIFNTQTLLELIINLAQLAYLSEQGLDRTIYDVLPLSGSKSASNAGAVWYGVSFEIEYETTKEVVFSAGKYEILRNERTIMDNQTNAWVNAGSQGNLEYQKANRIGNEVVMINQRSRYLANAIDLGDKLGDEIVYRTEYQVFDSYIDVNAYATKDYILQDYFTGINSKIRTWVNAQDEAFIRHDLYKYYVEFDEENSYEDIWVLDSLVDTNPRYTSTIKINNVISALNTSNNEPIKYVAFKSDAMGTLENTNQEIVDALLLNIIKRVIGNSIVLTWGFNDNYVGLKVLNVGNHEGSEQTKDDGIVAESDLGTDWSLESFGYSPTPGAQSTGYTEKMLMPHIKSGSLGQLGGVPLGAFTYCDDDGNFDRAIVTFFKELTSINQIGDRVNQSNYYNNIRTQVLGDLRSNTPEFLLDMRIHKDNKEIITGSLQIEYVSNSKKIYFYDNFLKLNELVEGTSFTGNFVMISNTPNIDDAVLDVGTVSVQNINDYSAQVIVEHTTASRYVFICKGNVINNIIPLVRLDTITSFYINLLRKRDKEGL